MKSIIQIRCVFFVICIAILIGICYTLYKTFHVIKESSTNVRDSIIITNIQVRDTIVINNTLLILT